ncbi:MAG: DUF4468 domain-containing protein [Flavobacteriaceae bacterium]|nr:DUF4468 domain-containing protein [Flavobacteriaceae bacterium]
MLKIITILLFSTLVCNAQNKLLDALPLKNGKVLYSSVLEVKDVSKDSLHLHAKKWLLNHSEKVEEIATNDNKYKEISGKVSFKLLWGPNDFKEYYVTVSPTFYFKIRNERYLYKVSDFIILQSGLTAEIEVYQISNNKYTKYNKLFYQNIDQRIHTYITSFETALEQKP